MLIAAATDFCKQTASIWQLVGYVMMIFKIVIPLLLIILGMFDLGKAVVANDDKGIQKATKQLAFRAVSGVIIFFIPTVVGFVFSIVAGFNDDAEVKANYEICKECLTDPTDKCSSCASKPEGDDCNNWYNGLKTKYEKK